MFTKLKLPVLYLDIWTIDDLFDFMDMSDETARKSMESRGNTLVTSEDLEWF